MYSQSQHHSYKSHIPQTNSLFSWLWVSKIALHRQQCWGLFDAKSKWGEPQEVTREMLWQSEQHSYPATSSAPVNNHPPHTRLLTELFTHKMPLQFKHRRNGFSSSAGKMQKSLPWENQCSSPSHCSGITDIWAGDTNRATTTRISHSLGSLGFLRKCLPRLCQRTSLIVEKFYYLAHGHQPVVTSKQWGGLSREFLHDYCLLSKPSPHSS